MSNPDLDIMTTTHFDYATMTYVITRYIMRDGEVVGTLKPDGRIELVSSQYTIEEVSKNARN